MDYKWEYSIEVTGLLLEDFKPSPISTFRKEGVFVEAIIEDGPDHCIKVELEVDGPLYQKLLEKENG